MSSRIESFDEIQAELLQELGFNAVLLNIAQAAKNLAKSGRLDQRGIDVALRLATRLRQLDKEVNKFADITNQEWEKEDLLVEIDVPSEGKKMLVFVP